MTMFVHDAILQELAGAKRRILLDEAAASRLAEEAAPKRGLLQNWLSRRRRTPAVPEETPHTFPAQPVTSSMEGVPSVAHVDALLALQRVSENEDASSEPTRV